MSLLCSSAVTTTLLGQGAKTLRSSVGGAQVSYDEFGDPQSTKCLIVLHGSSGTALPLYREQALFFGGHGFYVMMPHYFDATRSTAPNDANYQTWAAVTADFAGQCRTVSAQRKVFLVGYSLGASVALATGSQGAPIDAIAEWYGSLPDEFFYRLQRMPPLLILHGERDTNIPVVNGQQLVRLCEMKQLRCDHHFYPDQGHGFGGRALDDADQRTLAFFEQNLSEPQKSSKEQPK